MTCPSCGTANEPGRKFCGECGTRLVPGCPSCGSQNPPGTKFCGECGTRLDEAAPAAGPTTVTVPTTASGTERRLVSVLFADLVGFTSRSDGADPETIREFQSAYFDAARDVIDRYGGTVEKFIGDAVMAVWGAPIAREDDAERAVRAALDLVEAIRHIGRTSGDADLSLRAAVLTGEAAVAVGAVGQGMVSGDLVNTASRLQGVAPPGAVLVGEATKRSAGTSILFEEAGEQLLKGKEAPVAAWRALRVRGLVGSEEEGIETPFVGRDDELRLLKDFLHASARERRARLISVTGQAGIGKSRLARELRKYIDGITEGIFVHVGRSPSFGDGVTFWALGEMVRMRTGLAEGDDEARTRERVAAALAEYVADEDERRRIEPALLSLLGVGDPPTGGREALFGAWRSFFEQISLQGTTLLIFEDLQWADDGLLDFIDHLLEWSIGYPILVVSLARPELLDKRPTFGAGRRNFVALALGPLPDDAMRDMLTVLVPGLPLPTIRAILERADGIPLYAVETIRMLVEEGRLEEGDGSYRPVGDLGELHVPETLHALIAARLDAVDPADRALLQDGTILGQTFTVAALAALTGASAESLEPRLRALVQRELLVLDTDPRSPERGQYGFTQALVREVAHGTMSRKDRRDRHLAAARYFEALGDDEVAGVLATHYISAYEATPEGPEAEALGAQARIALRAAADRATSLGSHESAIAFWQRARTVTRDPAEDAELLEEIGGANRKAGHFEAAEQDLREASRRYREAGDLLASARATTVLCWVMSHTGRATEAHPIAIAAEAEVADRAPHAVLVKLWLALASLSIPAGERDSAAAWLERALADAEALGDPALVSQGMIDKGIFLAVLGRPIEGKALLEAGSAQAEALGDGIQSTIATLNISLAQMDADPRAALATSRKTLELAKRFGLVRPRLLALSNAIEASLGVGDWGWLQDELATIAIDELEPINRSAVLVGSLELAAVQGRDVASMESEIRAIMKTSEDTDLLGGVALAVALARNAEGRYEDASSEATIAERDPLNAPYALLLATRAAIRMGDGDRAMATLTRLDGLGIRGASSRAERDGLAAAISALDGRWPDAVAGFRDAWRRLRDLGLDVALGESQLDCIFVGPPDDPVVVEAAKEARETFGRTGALAYLRQLDEVEQRRGSPGTAVAADALSEVRG